MAVKSTDELPSEVLDLTSTTLFEMRALRTPELERAIQHTIREIRLGRFGDCVQGQRD
ncbi:hypothetical protein [Saccharothrix coeruleofusca]|nr:hypothetical protein [Saccharothrix coeruleofusca]MBP2337691.1 hypothetical protein [Saccharothrix coeruleofusca]